MHILIIPSEQYIPKDNHLLGIFQQQQAHALARATYQVGVISPFLRSLRLLKQKRWGWLQGIQTEEDRGVFILRYFGWQFPRIRQLIRRQWVATGKTLYKKYVKLQGQPNLIHAHNALLAGILANEIKKKWHVPFILTEHSSAYARVGLREDELESVRNAFKNSDRRLVVSPSLGQDLEKVVGSVVAPWEWVPNILAADFECETQTQMGTEHSRDQHVFLNVASLDENKGHKNLLNAFANQFQGRSDVQLRIGGDGVLRQELERLSQELGIDQQVTFLGRLNHYQVMAEMQACDTFVLSSHYETFGVVIIEALACGKPVISTACGGPEWIIHSENGVLVSARDVAALGQAMQNMQTGMYSYDAAQIRQDCITKFGEKTVVGHLSRIYDQVLLNT